MPCRVQIFLVSRSRVWFWISDWESLQLDPSPTCTPSWPFVRVCIRSIPFVNWYSRIWEVFQRPPQDPWLQGLLGADRFLTIKGPCNIQVYARIRREIRFLMVYYLEVQRILLFRKQNFRLIWQFIFLGKDFQNDSVESTTIEEKFSREKNSYIQWDLIFKKKIKYFFFSSKGS